MRAMRRGWAWGLVLLGGVAVGESLLATEFHVYHAGGFGWKRGGLLIAGVAAMVLGLVGVWRTWSGLPSEAQLWRTGRTCAPFLVAFGVYFCAFAVMSPVPEGDQPHYEIEAMSLAYDQDRDVSNDYATPVRFQPIFGPVVGDTHARRYRRGGPVVLISNVGLPLLLAPGVPLLKEFQVAAPYKARWPWHLEMIFLAALAAQVLYRILRRLRPEERFLRTAVWASVVFSAPMVVYASQIYPEIPAALLALIAVDAMLRTATRNTILSGALAVSLMPWLHVRYFPIALFLAVGLAIRAVSALPSGQRPPRVALRRAAWALAPLFASVAIMLIAFEHWYGSPLLDAQYQGAGAQSHSLSGAYRYLAGALWSSERGWLPFAPVALLALAAVPYVWRRYGRWALYGGVVAVGYLVLLAVQNADPGFSFAGRYEVILMPMAAIPLLLLLSEFRPARWIFWPLAAISMIVTAAVVLEPTSSIAGVPGGNGPLLQPHDFWKWFVDLWPAVVSGDRGTYPDVLSVVAWSVGLLLVGAAAYALVPRWQRGRSSAQ
jgi:hypothetical protein